MLTHSNGLSGAQFCDCKTKIKNEHKPTQQWKHLAPPCPDGRSRPDKGGMVTTQHLDYDLIIICPDSGIAADCCD